MLVQAASFLSHVLQKLVTNLMSQKRVMEGIVFSSESTGVEEFLEKLLACRNLQPLVSSFVDGVSSSLRKDIANLPHAQRQQVPPLANLSEWRASYKNFPRNAAVECALLTICQLCQWLE